VLLVVVLLVVSDHGAQGKLKKKQQQQQQQEEGEQVELATEEHAHDTEESESAQQQRHEIGGVEEIQPLPDGSIPPEIMELAEVRKSAVHFHTQKATHALPCSHPCVHMIVVVTHNHPLLKPKLTQHAHTTSTTN
jgi:hypothetical protein